MKSQTFSNKSFMIVDDDKMTRVILLRLFKNLGDPEVFCAENGLDALSMLESRREQIDCVLLDFNMPVIHGLQMLKLIRSGEKDIRRNLPVVLLTSHGESVLVKLAMDLDANTFVLKPAPKEVIVPRLKEILNIDKNDFSWLKEPEQYKRIDVDSSIVDILKANAKSQLSNRVLYSEAKTYSDDSAFVIPIEDLKPHYVLAQNIKGSDGTVYFEAGKQITPKIQSTLQDLYNMKLIGDVVHVMQVSSS